jgi:hypothetical protein
MRLWAQCKTKTNKKIHQKLEETRKDSSPEVSEVAWSLPAP